MFFNTFKSYEGSAVSLTSTNDDIKARRLGNSHRTTQPEGDQAPILMKPLGLWSSRT